MGLEYQPDKPWFVNISELHGAHVNHLTRLTEQRDRIASGPNAPELRRNDIAALDSQLAEATLHANASAEGRLYHDSASLSGCDPARTRWVAEASKRGMITRPGDVSVHESELAGTGPIRVDRGR